MAAEKKIPEIRFKGFEGEWNGQYVGNLFEIITDFVAAGSFEDLSKNVTYQSSPDFAQLVRTTDLKSNFTNKNYVYIDEKAFKYLWRVNLNSECVILPNIGNCGEVYLVTPKILPHKNNVLGPNAIYARSISNDNKFLSFSLSQDIFQKSLKNIISPNGQTKFNKTELKTLEVNIPTLPEQTQIGTYFQHLDSLISLHQRKYDKLLTVKKAMLEKMFPKEGADVPEIRFKGFEGKWEVKKVSDIFKVTRGNVLAATHTTEKQTEDAPYPVYSSQTKNDGLMGYYDQYLFENAITWTTDGANAGTVNYREGKFYSTNVNGVLLSENGYANTAVAESLNRIAWRHVSKVGNPKLMNNVMSEISLTLPIDTNELKAISKHFQHLDSLITQHQKQLEKLKNIKKACLEKMFV